MIELNLTANTPEQEVIKKYLENNVSEVLAEKINNGVVILKDGKRLISRKDLDTFMNYACDEARKLAEKGARSACIKSDVVFGWAIHYFEEAAIEGRLHNEDGTEYKPPKPVASKTSSVESTPPAPKSKPQATLFDLLDGQSPEKAIEPAPVLDELHQIDSTHYADADGVVYEVPEQKTDTSLDALREILGDVFIARLT